MKILEVPKNVFFKKMRELGAKKKYSVLMRVKYLDYLDHRIQKKQDLLRIRELTFSSSKKQKTEVVYKIYRGIKRGCKVFDELEFFVEGAKSFAQTCEFLQRLGFIQTLYYEKNRTTFVYRHWKFEFDEHPKIPSLLEIETQDEGEVNRMVKRLGFTAYEKSAETIEQLMKRKYPKIKLNGLVF